MSFRYCGRIGIKGIGIQCSEKAAIKKEDRVKETVNRVYIDRVDDRSCDYQYPYGCWHGYDGWRAT